MLSTGRPAVVGLALETGRFYLESAPQVSTLEEFLEGGLP